MPEFSCILLQLGESTNNVLARNSIALDNSMTLIVNGMRVGIVRSDIGKRLLAECPDVFVSTDMSSIGFSEGLTDFDGISAALAKAFGRLRNSGIFDCLQGWRNEDYGVRCRSTGQTLFKVERSAASLLGICQWGCHINGFTSDSNGQLAMWIAKRSLSKPTWPGYYDNMVGGGLPHGISPTANAVKEAAEEAGIPLSLTADMQSVGTVSYCYQDSRGVFPEVAFCYDLQLPPEFLPRNADGEVEEFHLVPIVELPQWLARPDFMPNSALICLDFLIRHGHLQPDSTQDYELLVELCHARLPLD